MSNEVREFAANTARNFYATVGDVLSLCVMIIDPEKLKALPPDVITPIYREAFQKRFAEYIERWKPTDDSTAQLLDLFFSGPPGFFHVCIKLYLICKSIW